MNLASFAQLICHQQIYQLGLSCQLTTISFILAIQALWPLVAHSIFSDAVRIVATGVVIGVERFRVNSGITSKAALCVTRYQHSVV
jgi:hypothetical protein